MATPLLVPRLQSLNQDQDFWWEATASSFSSLLKSCDYTECEQQFLLQWYSRFILPALGPRPWPDMVAKFNPCPVFDGSACEFSINWRERSPHRMVRFTIEATGMRAGTDEDPFNQEATQKLLRDMCSEVPGLSLKRFDLFALDLFFSKEAAVNLAPRVPTGTPLSQAWVAFDLVQKYPMAKVYFMPILKWIDTGRSTNELVFETARKCNTDEYGSFDEPVNMLQAYIETFTTTPDDAPRVEMVAIDCVDSPDARIKIYLRTAVNTLARAKNMYTLGGRLKGQAVTEGLQALHELWPILFRLDAADPDMEHAEVFPRGSYCGCAVEMKPGRQESGTKLHIPVRKIVGTDADLCEALAAWFRRRGHGEFASRYKEDLKKAFPLHDLDSAGGTHSFISFSYTEKSGVYMTFYYSTKILDIHVNRVDRESGAGKDIWKGYDNLWSKKRGITLN
ncbi:7-dimethylallyltryptophan synthase 2 [Colletotrichum chlorophyti]|uniref:7-dimethylallyltryptophan synthase 2 n=1 Tax=Colletotrichum chlorophyti TaxID=708187 RepID=A0A1Q8S239_9PEZI|nr:7-dimethylallyltryptophan synthase 2 [Colletotrichum chlorophyti]